MDNNFGEQILRVYWDTFLSKDNRCKVVEVADGYVIYKRASINEEWVKARHCLNPDDLTDSLMECYIEYLESKQGISSDKLSNLIRGSLISAVDKE